MHIRTHIGLYLLALFASSSQLAAQGEVASWSIRVAAIDIVGEHHTLWLRTSGRKDPVEVPINTRVFSPSIQFTGAARLDFHASAAEASAEVLPHPLASTSLTGKSSLLVFAPDVGEKGYRIFVTPDEDFPFGSFRLVNLSAATVRAEFAAKVIILRPGAAETITYREGEQAIPVRILAMEKDAEPRLVRQSSWSIVPNQRELVLLLPNERNGLVQLRHFVDSKEEVPPE